MGNRLDTILIQEILTSPTTVNTDFSSNSIDISFREAEFSIQVGYTNGVNVDMDFQIEVSNDNQTFIPVTESIHTIVDSDGTSFFDIAGTGANYLRVGVVVRTGSIDLQEIVCKSKRRH